MLCWGSILKGGTKEKKMNRRGFFAGMSKQKIQG